MARHHCFGMDFVFASLMRGKRIRLARGAMLRGLLPALPFWLVLTVTAPVCAQQADDPHRDAEPMALAPPAPSSRSLAAARIHTVLDSPAQAEFVDTPITNVALFLSDYHHIPVYVDHEALKASASPPESPINGTFNNVKLRTALNWLLQPYDWTYIVRDEALVITSRDVGRKHLSTRLYPIADLLGADSIADAEQWIDILHSAAWYGWWSFPGDGSAAREFRGALSISQTDEGHVRVQQFLDAVRQARRESRNAAGKYVGAVVNTYEAAAAVEWKSQLERRFESDDKMLWLPAVQKFVQRQVGDKVVLDRRVDKRTAVGEHQPIEFSQTGISLHAALKGMLRELDLGWTIQGEVLVISDKYTAGYYTDNRIYAVADLVQQADGALDSAPLKKLLYQTIEPGSWYLKEGQGEIHAVPGHDLLVISQTADVHDRIERFLQELRATPLLPPAKSVAADRRWKSKVFRLEEGLDSKVLAEVVRQMFEPQHWPIPAGEPSRKVVLSPVQGRLAMQHSAELVDLVDDLLGQATGHVPESQETFYERLNPWPWHTPLFSLNERSGLTVRCYRLPLPPASPPANPFDGDQPMQTPELPENETYAKLLREMVLQDQWDDDEPGRIAVLPGMILVRQTRAGHDAVVEFFRKTMNWDESRTPSPFD